MAEIVGVVASGISIGTLAAQVASSIIKLKSLWNEVRDAPEDIKDLIDEIELLNNILLGLDEVDPSLTVGLEQRQSREECLRHCRAASRKISLLVEDLHAEIEKSKGLRRKIVSAKLILRKDQVKKYKSRLKGAVRLLSLSEQCYARAYQRQIHAIVAQLSLGNYAKSRPLQQDTEWKPIRVTYDSNSAENEDGLHSVKAVSWTSPSRSPLERLFGYVEYGPRLSTSANWNSYRRCESKASDEEQHEGAQLRYRTPAWLTNQVWEVCNMKARKTWTCNLRVYNVIPRDSLIFEFTQKGNLGAVQTLFSRRMASPFDRRDGDGSTALHIAARNGNFAMCKLLLEAGTDPDVPDFSSRTPFSELSEMGGSLAFMDGVSVVDLFRLFLSREADVLAEDGEGVPVVHLFRGPMEALKLLLRQTISFGSEIPLEFRVKAAIRYSECLWHNTPQLVWTILGPGTIEHAARITEENGTTIVHGVLRALAQTIAEQTKRLPGNKFYDIEYWDSSTAAGMRTSQYSKMRCDWTALLEELMKAGADLHNINSYGRTPFLGAFEGCLNTTSQTSPESIHHVFQSWLQDLRDAGIDLLEYGHKEARLHTLGNCDKDFSDWEISVDEFINEYHLIGFTYGPDPEDWHFWMLEPTDVYAGDFWRSIESEYKKRVIPGAWID